MRVLDRGRTRLEASRGMQLRNPTNMSTHTTGVWLHVGVGLSVCVIQELWTEDSSNFEQNHFFHTKPENALVGCNNLVVVF